MHKADNLTTILGHCHEICEPNFLEPYGHLGSVMGMIYLFLRVYLASPREELAS